MTWARRVLLDQEVQAVDAGTRRVPLPARGALSGIELRVGATNGATRGAERLFDSLTRVEVVANGSQVLYSLEGAELYRWAHFILRKEPPHIWTEQNGIGQRLNMPICFGRYMGDPDFWLDLSQYQAVELRVTYAPTIAATGFVTGTFQIHAPYWIDDSPAGPPGRRGFLRTTQVKAFTSLAAGEDITELSRLFRYMDMLVYCRHAAVADGGDLTIAEVRANDKALIPATGRWDDWAALAEDMLGVNGDHEGVMFPLDTETSDVHTGRILDVHLMPTLVQSDANGLTTYTIGGVAGDRITHSCSDLADAAATTHFTAAAARKVLYFRATGLGVGNAILIPFALHGNPDEALDAPSFSRLQLALTQGGAGSTVRVSTREVVPA
jgi:hypothetical protein